MEEDHEEQKHVCKLCDRRFPCGRSLGGHMRSHVIIMNNNKNIINNSDETLKKKKKKKLSSVNNNGGFNNNNNKSTIGDTSFEGGGGGYQIGYGLRENPKKTFRFEKEGEEDGNLVVNDKVCKECGKGFQSWKALFGHMKCHSDKVHKNNISFLEEQSSSWTNNANQKLVMDSQSDNDTSAPARLNRRRSSRRRRTRYMAAASAATAATTSSSLSLANYASSSVTEIEQEQEEVALCLMMLSRDVGHWVGLNSAAESSDNDSVFLEAPPPSLRINQVMEKSTTICDGSLRIGSMMKRLEVPLNVFPGNDNYKFEVSEVELGKSMIKPVGDQAPLSSNKYNLSKKRLCGADLVLNSSKKTIFDASDSELCRSSYKRSKFECTTCNKIFHSYQALGGHRASHKKIKGCCASKIESCENSIETELISPEQTTIETEVRIKSYNNGKNPIEMAPAASYAEKPEAAKKASKKSISSIKGHECPICFKVFSSGQALGGHKRSHLVNSSEAKTDHYHHQAIIIQKPNRDFLDLNLPAPVEEESNTNHGHVGIKPWWVGSSHKHEALFGMISN